MIEIRPQTNPENNFEVGSSKQPADVHEELDRVAYELDRVGPPGLKNSILAWEPVRDPIPV
jgi:hypothetical protein